MNQVTGTKIKKTPWFVGIFSIGILIALMVFTQSSSVAAKLNDWKLLPQTEHFTELYFNSYPQVASQVLGGTKVSFVFTAHNLEGATTTYPYVVYFSQTGSGTTTVDSGSFTLADNASTTISEMHTLSRAYEPGMFSVVLPAQHLHVDFYVPNPAGK